ncbi:MAG: glutathione S-transferase family protein [Xanthobacteraceae bacterium]
MLVLYHSGLTTCSKQVRHCLREKGLAYESRYINLLRFEHLSPDYLKLNPNGVVPTLVHDGHVVINSACINEYIDEAFSEPRLSPADPRARARMRLWTWTADDAHHQGARLTRNRKLKASVEAMSAADVALVLERMPVPARREHWQQQTSGGHSEAEMEIATAHMHFVADRMERDLAREPWLAGEVFSLGDISMASLIHRCFELFPDMLPRATYPRLNDWYARLMARPAAAFVYTPGTAETPKIPQGRSVAGIREYRAPSS